jgi:hypothetical protein
MPRAHFSREQPVEYFILVEPRADGPVVGNYNGHPIAAAVRDCYGRRFTYAGVASRLRNGAYDVEALSPGEWFVQPGLIYQMEPTRSGGMLEKFRRRRERGESESDAPR